MKWWRALWAALQSFFAALKGQPDPADIRAEQDKIQQETQEQIDEVPQMSDDELDSVAESTGLLQRETGGSSRAKELGADRRDWTYYWGEVPPSKTDRESDS